MTPPTGDGQDPDVAHLLDLLDLLPRLDDADFWKPLTKDGTDTYRLEKLMGWTRLLRERPEQEDSARRLAEYCLLFFGPGTSVQPEKYDPVLPTLRGRGQPGRLWVEDVARTAWRVYVTREAEARRRDQGPLHTGFDSSDYPPESLLR